MFYWMMTWINKAVLHVVSICMCVCACTLVCVHMCVILIFKFNSKDLIFVAMVTVTVSKEALSSNTKLNRCVAMSMCLII